MRVTRAFLLSLLSITVVLGTAVAAIPAHADSGDTMSFTVEPNSSYQSLDQISVTVQVLDASSNPVPGSTVDLAPTGGDSSATLGGTTSQVTDSNGNAVFTDLTIDKVGTGYQLVASDADVTGTTDSSPFDITAGPAFKVVFTTQPAASVMVNSPLPEIDVEAFDQGGNDVSSGKAVIAIDTNPGGATISKGDTSITAGGTPKAWRFTGLTLNKPGIGYTLVVTVGDLTSPDSTPFTVKGTPTLTVTENHTTITAGATVTVTVKLSACKSPCSVVPTLTYKLKSDGSTASVPALHWTPSTRTGTVTTPRYRNGSFIASYAGDGLYVATDTSKDPLALGVRAAVGDSLHGGYAVRSGYRLYHYQSSCQRSKVRCPLFTATIQPNKDGKKASFALQAYQRGRWSTIATTQATFRSGSAGVIWRYLSSSVKGIALRTRATYPGDLDNLAGTGAWRYFKITS